MSVKTKIIGPISLTEHYNENTKKWVYIFGDNHVKETTCDEEDDKTIHIKDLLINTIESNPNKLIDIFLEKGKKDIFGDTYETDFQSYLEDVTNEFLNCSQHLKQECKYPNIRIHNLDSNIRTNVYYKYSEIMSYKDDLTKLIMLFNVLSNNLIDENPTEKKIRKNNKLFQSIKRNKLFNSDILVSVENIYKELNKFIFIELKIKKQIEKVQDKKIVKNLIENFNNSIVDIYDGNTILDYILLQKLINITPELTLKEYKNEDFFLYFQSINYGVFIPLMSCVMDLYAMLRLFKTYDTTNSYRKEKGLPDNNTSMYSIFYVGENHAINYRKILTELEYKTINKYESTEKNKNFQCLDISKFNQPFFNTKDNNQTQQNISKDWIIFGNDSCPFCIKSKKYLDEKNIKYIYIDISELKCQDLFEIIKSKYKSETIPMIFYKGNYIGGYDKLIENGKINQPSSCVIN